MPLLYEARGDLGPERRFQASAVHRFRRLTRQSQFTTSTARGKGPIARTTSGRHLTVMLYHTPLYAIFSSILSYFTKTPRGFAKSLTARSQDPSASLLLWLFENPKRLRRELVVCVHRDMCINK